MDQRVSRLLGVAALAAACLLHPSTAKAQPTTLVPGPFIGRQCPAGVLVREARDGGAALAVPGRDPDGDPNPAGAERRQYRPPRPHLRGGRCRQRTVRGSELSSQWGLRDLRRGGPQHKALEKAALRRIRFHDLRHTFASRLLQNGESAVYVKDELGHHSIKVTVDVYGHLLPGANKVTVEAG